MAYSISFLLALRTGIEKSSPTEKGVPFNLGPEERMLSLSLNLENFTMMGRFFLGGMPSNAMGSFNIIGVNADTEMVTTEF